MVLLFQVRGFYKLQRIRKNKSVISKKRLRKWQPKRKTELVKWKSKRKYAQHHLLSEKCKSKPLWGTILHHSEWLRSKSLQAINAGEGMEKREPSYTVGGNANYPAFCLARANICCVNEGPLLGGSWGNASWNSFSPRSLSRMVFSRVVGALWESLLRVSHGVLGWQPEGTLAAMAVSREAEAFTQGTKDKSVPGQGSPCIFTACVAKGVAD